MRGRDVGVGGEREGGGEREKGERDKWEGGDKVGGSGVTYPYNLPKMHSKKINSNKSICH